MIDIRIKTDSPESTIEFGKKLALELKKRDVVALYGELGSGKTTLIKGLVYGLGYEKNIKSPSFIIVAVYKGRLPIYHIDLYRIRSLTEIENIGFNEYLFGDGVSLIEWAEKVEEILPKETIRVRIKILSENEREILVIKP